MSYHNHPDYQDPQLIAALKAHHLPHDTPSMNADCFRHGWMAAKRNSSAVGIPAGYIVVPFRPPEEALVQARSAYGNATVYDVALVWESIVNYCVNHK